jgi:Flp pilus assembly protein TadB
MDVMKTNVGTILHEGKEREKEKKEVERKEMERKEMERKEMERKEMERKETERKEIRARNALHELGLEVADRWASGFQKRPTQQLILQKIIDPAVKHILQTIFPWIVGVAILFLLLLICTVVTCFIVLRSGTTPIGNVVQGTSFG